MLPRADPAEPYVRATPNAWSVFSVDAERGLVFVPTGNVQVDLYGGDRGGLENGRDYYSSSVVALEAATGRCRLAFPDRAPRHLGLRRAVAAGVVRLAHGPRPGARARAADEDRVICTCSIA